MAMVGRGLSSGAYVSKGNESQDKMEADIARMKHLTKELFNNVQETESFLHKRRDKNVKQEKQKREAFVKKVNARVKEGQEAMWVADEASSVASHCLSQLQHEHYSLGVALMVCQRRLELRDGRPPQEAKDDKLQQALLSEQEILVSAREAMLVLGGVLMRRVEDVTKLRYELSAETAFIRREGNVRNAQGRDLSLESFDGQSQVSIESSPEGGKTIADGYQATAGLQRKLFDLQAEVEDLSGRTDQLLKQSHEAVHQSNLQVKSILKRTTLETEALVRKIRTHVTDAENSLLMAERALEKSVRKLNPDDTQGLSKFAVSKGMVEELRTSKSEMLEELWRKTHCLNIDEACMKVTPQCAAGICERADKPGSTATSPTKGRSVEKRTNVTPARGNRK